jgi:hypothetical protein
LYIKHVALPSSGRIRRSLFTSLYARRLGRLAVPPKLRPHLGDLLMSKEKKPEMGRKRARSYGSMLPRLRKARSVPRASPFMVLGPSGTLIWSGYRPETRMIGRKGASANGCDLKRLAPGRPDIGSRKHQGSVRGRFCLHASVRFLQVWCEASNHLSVGALRSRGRLRRLAGPGGR